jgi:RNA-directed DNA polymerase
MFLHLSSRKNGINKRIFKLDIAKCFDRISHEAILDKVIAPNFLIKGLRRCLKARGKLKMPLSKNSPRWGMLAILSKHRAQQKRNLFYMRKIRR